jgi:hypothetical protein
MQTKTLDELILETKNTLPSPDDNDYSIFVPVWNECLNRLIERINMLENDLVVGVAVAKVVARLAHENGWGELPQLESWIEDNDPTRVEST